MNPTSLQTAFDTTLTFVLKKLDADDRPWREISDDCGVPYDTLTKVGQRHVVPKVPTLQKLENYYRARTKRAA